MPPQLRFAQSAEDRERIYRFRYRIYVEEMGRTQKFADHLRKRICEPLDATAHLLLAELDGRVVGTLRTNFARESDLSYYPDLFALRSVGAAYPDAVSLTTKLMIEPTLRSTGLAVRLAHALFEFGASHGIRHDFIDCNAHLESFFERLGYQRYHPKVVHPEYGEVLPLRLDLQDHDYLDRVRSPFLRRVRRGRDEPNLLSLLPTETTSTERSAHPEMNSTSLSTHTPDTVPTPLGGTDLIAWLDGRMASLLGEIESTHFWRTVTSPNTDLELLRSIMREVYLEIFSYQPHAIEGAIAAIAQMPRSLPVRMLKAMLRHQAEEFDHGEMALRDYVALGGNESYARQQHRISAASFAVASVWRTLPLVREPFAYLGALYPFEGLTPIVSEKIKSTLLARGFPTGALEFVEFHSTEDPKHTELVKHLIQETVTRYPEAEAAIRAGLDRFLAVYPIPVWQTAFARACAGAGRENAEPAALLKAA